MIEPAAPRRKGRGRQGGTRPVLASDAVRMGQDALIVYARRLLLVGSLARAVALAAGARDWPQWGGNPGHEGASAAAGQPLVSLLADVVYDPFVAQEAAESGEDLLVHYAVPLLDATGVFLSFKSGSYLSCDPPGSGLPAPCGPDAWGLQTWNVRRLAWKGGALATEWTFASDWKPEPAGGALANWEPVFQPSLAGEFLYVPGFAGTIFQVSRATGNPVARIRPFGETLDPGIFVAGGLAADASGSVFYNAIRLDRGNPWSSDVLGAWLVKVGAGRDGLDRALLDARCRRPGAACPVPDELRDDRVALAAVRLRRAPRVRVRLATPRHQRGSRDRARWDCLHGLSGALQRALRVPGRGPSGPDARVERVAEERLERRLRRRPAAERDGRGMPVRLEAGSGSRDQRPSRRARVGPLLLFPVVLPDGGVLYGAFTSYNFQRGHLFKFGPDGRVVATYDFGWDITPALFRHEETYSIVLKDNHYAAGSYCGDPAFCPPETPRYDIVSLDSNLSVEWKFTSTNTLSCRRGAGGEVTCVSDHPDGFEWCINQPAVDGNGVTYANSEDGFLYAIGRGGVPTGKIFLNLAIGAAYTPLSISSNGLIYAQNNGHLFVLGNPLRSLPRAADRHGTPRTIDAR